MPPFANLRKEQKQEQQQQQRDDYPRVLNGTSFDSDIDDDIDNFDSNKLVDIPLTPNRALRHPKAVSLSSAPGDEISWDTTTKSILPTPPPPPLPTEEEEEDDDNAAAHLQQTDADDDADEPKGVLGKMLDFNPCAAKIPNPHSALFKERRCAECGSRVYKYRNGGYETEVVLKKQKEQQQPRVVVEDLPEEDEDGPMPSLADDATAFSDKSVSEESDITTSCCGGSHASAETAVSDTTTDAATGVETKIYFMKSCYEKRQHRKAHRANGYGLVMVDLLDYFAQKASDERSKAAEEAAAQQAATERAAAEQAEREEAAALPLAKEKTLKGRTKKALRSMKKSFGGCFSATAAVASTTTPQKVQAQPPSRSMIQLSWGDHHEEQTLGDSGSDDDEHELDEPNDDDDLLPVIRRALTSEEPPEEPQRPVQLSWGGSVETAEALRPVQLSWGGRAEHIDNAALPVA